MERIGKDYIYMIFKDEFRAQGLHCAEYVKRKKEAKIQTQLHSTDQRMVPYRKTKRLKGSRWPPPLSLSKGRVRENQGQAAAARL
jgi:hypothetical protein